ncbi:MAG: hypothetical protein HY749_14840 [Gammaproteobacteria bacterium]|nr:hypothetical protein [Gammaproteobacteria bacterium]
MSGGLKGRVKVLIGLAALIAAWVVLTPAPEDEAVVGAATDRAPAVQASRAAAPGQPAPAPRTAAAEAHRSVPAQAPDALFAAHTWHVEPPPLPPQPAVVAAPPPPPPPSAPPLPFTFMGSYLRKGEGVIYFLSRDDRVYDVHAGEAIDDTYRLDGVKDGKLLFTYRPLRQQQALPIGDGS